EEANDAITQQGLWKRLNTLVRRVRVLDPACGSGSFLVGMLLVLDDLQDRCGTILGEEETPYERRRHILQDQLYGVDIMEWAVRVAELRLWLQLVVETKLSSEERYLRPLLPNLSFKLRPGDSLLQTVGELDLSPFRRHELALPPNLKGQLSKLQGRKRRFFQGERGLREEMLKKEERDLFRAILSYERDELAKQLRQKRRTLEEISSQRQMFAVAPSTQGAGRRKQLEREISELEERLAQVERALQALRPEEGSPFVWDIAFVEIFEGEPSGFDIVIGNPPYVRQEKIRDHLGRFSRAEYLRRLNESLRAIYPAFMGKSRKLAGEADYYIYFYLHGLSLLAEEGSFCFITSNSWLDVDFGKDLQEFLLRHGHVKMILDNRVKRSFGQADVNTVIVLLGPPLRKRALSEEEMRTRLARFVSFQVPFAEALSPVFFSEIEDESAYEPPAGFRVLRRPEFRSVLWDQWALYQEGLEEPSEGQILKQRRYVGNKWGGKYLRAPNILWDILSRNHSSFVYLSTLADILGYIHDNNTGAKFPKVPFVKTIKDLTRIKVNRRSSGVHLFGVKLRGFSKVIAPILIARTYESRLFVVVNEDKVYFKEFYKILPKKVPPNILGAYLNSTFSLMITELYGVVLGGGGLKSSIFGIKLYPVHKGFLNQNQNKLLAAFNHLAGRPIRSIFEELGFVLCQKRGCRHPEHPYEHVRPEALTLEQVQQASPDRFALDSIVFDVLGLTEEERRQVYQAVAQLVKDRLVKAKSQ
ncbi:MAG: Eco57I restriction-modification methylase domain-containing protein, partial [Anaerolineae bacterium]|nr:Eco57I restriction-modification methylase domain-containing protein [Anaerolineae bacterium]